MYVYVCIHSYLIPPGHKLHEACTACPPYILTQFLLALICLQSKNIIASYPEMSISACIFHRGSKCNVNKDIFCTSL